MRAARTPPGTQDVPLWMMEGLDGRWLEPLENCLMPDLAGDIAGLVDAVKAQWPEQLLETRIVPTDTRKEIANLADAITPEWLEGFDKLPLVSTDTLDAISGLTEMTIPEWIEPLREMPLVAPGTLDDLASLAAALTLDWLEPLHDSLSRLVSDLDSVVDAAAPGWLTEREIRPLFQDGRVASLAEALTPPPITITWPKAESEVLETPVTSRTHEVDSEIWLEEDITGQIQRRLQALDEELAVLWDGAVSALAIPHEDAPRHAAASLRALLWTIRNRFAPAEGSDRQRFRALLASRSGGDLAAACADLMEVLLEHTSKLTKYEPAPLEAGQAVLCAAASILLSVLPAIEDES